jgi:hypothetical protein
MFMAKTAGKSENAVTQAVEATTNAAQNAAKEENQSALAPADGARITS